MGTGWVLDGHKTPDPVGSKYAGVVSRESVQITFTYAGLNGPMYAWQTPEMPTFSHQHPKTLHYLWTRGLQNSQHIDRSSICHLL